MAPYTSGVQIKIYMPCNPNGTVKWSFNSGYQIGYTPSIDSEGTIYLVCSGMLYALNPNGTEKWNYTPDYRDTIGTSPAIGADGTIYIEFPVTDIWLTALYVP